MQVHSQLAEWSQDLHQLKSIMDTLEEEDQLLTQSIVSDAKEANGSNSAESSGAASGGKSMRDLTASVSKKTEDALSVSSQTPQDGLELLEGIAHLSQQMVEEAKEDVELFNRAGNSANAPNK